MDEKLQRQINHYRNSGFDEESLAMASKDFENGIGFEFVDCYMNANLAPEHRLTIAELFHQGMPLDIGTALRGMNKSQLDEVFSHNKERVPFDALRTIVLQGGPAHQIKKAFALYMDITKDFAKKVTIENPSTKVDSRKIDTPEIKSAVANTPGTETIKEASATAEDHVLTESEPHIAQAETTDTSETTPVVEHSIASAGQTPTPNSKELIKEIQKVFSESTKTLVDNINDHNAGIYADMITKFDDGIQAILDEIHRDMRNNYQLQIPKAPDTTVVDEHRAVPTQTTTPQVAPAPTPIAPSEPAAFDSQVTTSSPLASEPAAETPAPAPVSERVAEFSKVKKPHPDYLEDAVSYMKVVLMPDGSLKPIEIEQEKPKKPRGLIGWASRIFGKDAPQESLLRQLINGKLSASQLKQIQRAVKAAFSPLEVKDLIESDLEPDEMGNIIDVILADRGQIPEVV